MHTGFKKITAGHYECFAGGKFIGTAIRKDWHWVAKFPCGTTRWKETREDVWECLLRPYAYGVTIGRFKHHDTVIKFAERYQGEYVIEGTGTFSVNERFSDMSEGLHAFELLCAKTVADTVPRAFMIDGHYSC